MEYPLISVIITAYNYAHTLPQAIDSALQQDYPNLEVLVMDNASTDSTQAVLATYAHEPRLRFRRNESTLHSVENHNAGLPLANGSYIIYLSADDQLVGGYIKRAFDYLLVHPEIDLVYSGVYTMNMEGRFLDRRMNMGEPPCGYDGGRNELAGLFAYGCYIIHGTILTHRRNYERFGGFSQEFTATDYDLYIRWAVAGLRMARLSGCGAIYRIHPGGISSVENYNHTGKELHDYCGFIKKYITPQTAHRIRGYESLILAGLEGRFHSSKDHVHAYTERNALEYEACKNYLQQLRVENSHAAFEPKVVILFIANGPLHEIHRSLISLLEQTYENWEALILEQPNTTLAGFCNHLDPRGRITACNWERLIPPGQSLNIALTLTSANCCTFMETGTIFPPNHLETVVSLFRGPQFLSLVSQTDNTVVDSKTGRREDHQGFINPKHFEQLEIYPMIPIDAIAIKREAYDRVYCFNEKLEALPEWDFLLRIAGLGKMGMINSTITRYSIVDQPLPDLTSGAYARVARSIYQFIPAKNEEIALQRQEYLRELEHVVQQGAQALATMHELIGTVERFRGTAYFHDSERKLAFT